MAMTEVAMMGIFRVLYVAKESNPKRTRHHIFIQ